MTEDFLCLDLARIIGFARWKEGQDRPSIASHTLPDLQDGVGRYLCAYEDFLEEQVSIGMPTFVVYEKPYVGKRTTYNTGMGLFTLAGETERFFKRRNMENMFSVKPNDWRNHFVGVGSGKREELKRLTQEKAASIGFDGLSEDEADAFGILDHAVDCMKVTPPWAAGPLLMGAGT